MIVTEQVFQVLIRILLEYFAAPFRRPSGPDTAAAAVNIEVKQAVIRRYAPGKAYAAGDPFNLVATLDFIGRGEVQIGADLALTEWPTTRADLRELRRQLVADFRVKRAYCWRLRGAKPPFRGRVIRSEGPLDYWEMPLA